MNINRLRIIRETIGVNQSEFARTLGVAPSFISGIERNVKEVSRDLLQKILEKYQVNINFLLSGEGEMFLLKSEEQSLQEEKPSLGTQIDQRLEKIEAQIAEIRGQLKVKEMDGHNFGIFVSESEPEYGDDYAKVPFVDNIAAGPPIQQSEDLSEFIDVPMRFIKTKPADYYAARIRGESMTAAGIPDGCTVLIRRSDVPRDGAIQVVRCGGKSTLKRMREGEDHTWTLHYEDNTERLIPIGKDAEYQAQGDFVAVLPED